MAENNSKLDHATTQGAAHLLANPPSAHYTPPPPTNHNSPPAVATFASKAKAAANIPQPAAPKQPKGKSTSRPKTKAVNARNN
ncbi:hypothetical protein H0H81_009842, partial [Sphagnurus paluster]